MILHGLGVILSPISDKPSSTFGAVSKHWFWNSPKHHQVLTLSEKVTDCVKDKFEELRNTALYFRSIYWRAQKVIKSLRMREGKINRSI